MADREQYAVTELTIVNKIILADGTEITVSGDLIQNSATNLTLSSTNPLTVKLDDTDAIKADNAAISGFAAAADTDGNSVYVETEDGGVDTAVDGGSAGGLFNVKAGDGSAGGDSQSGGIGGAVGAAGGVGGLGGSTTGVGGAGGPSTLTGGLGGAQQAGATDGGVGGVATVTSGDGGAQAASTGAGGAGGVAGVVAGDGGDAAGGSGDGGAGGVVNLAGGTGGTSSGGAVGAPGKVKVTVGRFEFVNAQTLDMADGQVVLTLNPDTPTGTLITSNIMYVDANSSSVEDLLLPPEADSNGLELIIKNTGGETIVVKEDGDATIIASVPALNTGIFVCDGTTWSGGVTNIDLGAFAMGSIDFNATGVNTKTITINGVVYTAATDAPDFPNGVWDEGANAAESAVSLASAINGDTRATVNVIAFADESGDGVILTSEIPGVAGNFTLASNDGSATVSGGTMLHGENVSHSRMTTYEHTVNTNDDLAGSIDIPLPFAPVGFTFQIRSSTGLYELSTALVTIETTPNRIHIDYDGATDPDAGDIINIVAWN